MALLPVLERLEVVGYGLYPGTQRRPGLHANLTDGLFLVLGANGLGKTTLVTMLFRMLAGNRDMRQTGASAIRLGGRKLDPRELRLDERTTFASRVNDGAVGASALLEFRLGERLIRTERLLSNLEIVSLSVDGEALEADDDTFGKTVAELAGVSTVGDWILALRHLVFYFEDRQALIWDPSAQRQLLRFLFLKPDLSEEWMQRERRILELDSLVRNLNYALNKSTRELARVETAAASASDVRRELALLQKLQAAESERLDELSRELGLLAAERAEARLRSLQAEQAESSARLEVEGLELHALDAAFPSASATARYLLAHILTDKSCLTCGSDVPDFRAILERRIAEDHCVVCGSEVTREYNERAHHPRLLARARKKMAELEVATTTARSALALAEQNYARVLQQVSELTASTTARSVRMDEMARQLPPEASKIVDQLTGLDRIRAEVAVRESQLRSLREEFKYFIDEINRGIALRKEAIKDAFERYVRGFLIEECELLWQPKSDRLGETGERVEFPAFELRMSGASVAGSTIRSGPQQVSESQREFIDLSFRMALMDVASGASSLVIDAPESSLDAVFVERAADVLGQFAARPNHRLIVTSNLIEGDLIPSLMAAAGIRSAQSPRILDLLRVAAPTPATRALAKEYAEVRAGLFRQAAAKAERVQKS